MKKFQLLKWTLSLVVFINFSACVNEALEGDFPQNGDIINIDVGEFRADIGFNNFTADIATGVLSTANILTITGSIIETGESIILIFENPGIGTFNLTAVAGTDNSGSYFETSQISPYVSLEAFGASGQLNITEFDIQNLTITGTFSFTGFRLAVDADGNPILDTNGDQIIDTDYLDILGAFKDSEADAGTVVFESIHPRWSYVKVSDDGNVIESAEKKPISNIATAGFYLYKKASMFSKFTKKMIMKDANVDDIFYICPVFNEMVLEQKIIKTFTIKPQQYHSFMSPEMLINYKEFLN